MDKQGKYAIKSKVEYVGNGATRSGTYIVQDVYDGVYTLREVATGKRLCGVWEYQLTKAG